MSDRKNRSLGERPLLAQSGHSIDILASLCDVYTADRLNNGRFDTQHGSRGAGGDTVLRQVLEHRRRADIATYFAVCE
jgi:poly-gamma-glutamate capsule biosynthesis protein CapA/YwtB (metallophosphatase superfamily)